MARNVNTWFLAVLSGALLCLSFPKYGSGALAWIALIPLLQALLRQTVRSGFALGFATGLIFHTGLIYWITYVVVHYGRLPVPIGIAAMVGLASYLSLYTAVFAAGVVFFRGRGIPALISAPLLWTGLEYGKSHLLTGFPWENLAYSQYLCPTLIQIADITGPYGLSCVIVLINVILHDLILFRKERRRVFREAVLAVAVLATLCAYGQWRIAHIDRIQSGAPTLPVLLAQGNIEQDIKWDATYQRETLDIYRTLSLQTGPFRNGLIVWPETAAPFFFQDPGALQGGILEIPRQTGAWLLFGSPSYRKEGSESAYLNSAFLLSPAGEITGRYDKVHLVPYGEYVPLRNVFPFIGKLVAGIGDFERGRGYFPLAMGDLRLGTLICYEGILPEASRAYKKGGANLLVNITNDAWFGDTSAPRQHLSMTTFRSVETRIYLVRAANTGISAIIDPAGRILSQTALFQRTTLVGTVKMVDEGTFYGAYGDIFAFVCLGLIGAIGIISIKKRSKDHAGDPYRKHR